MNEEKDSVEKVVSIMKFTALTFMVWTIVFGSFYTISAGERGVLLTWGKPSEQAISEGLHFKIPLMQKIVKIEVRTKKYEAQASAASKDLQVVTSNIATNYRLVPESVPNLYQEVGLDYEGRIIQPLEQEVVKSITAKYTAEELITRREEVRQEIKSQLHDRLSPRGIVVEEVSIVNFDFSESFNQAIEQKVTAEQNALAAKNRLEQIRYEGEQIVVTAKANAEAIQIQAQAIQSQGGKDYVQLQAIAKWDGKLPTFTGGAMPFINVGPTTTQ